MTEPALKEINENYAKAFGAWLEWKKGRNMNPVETDLAREAFLTGYEKGGGKK